MADKKPRLTQDVPVPPGVVLTPDYEAPEQPEGGRVRYADRRIDAQGNVLHPSPDGSYEHLSTYGQGDKAASQPAPAAAPASKPAQG